MHEFDVWNADVFCRSINGNDPTYQMKAMHYYKTCSNTINWLSHINCGGSETNILNCPVSYPEGKYFC